MARVIFIRLLLLLLSVIVIAAVPAVAAVAETGASLGFLLVGVGWCCCRYCWEPRSHLALSGHWGLGVYIRGCDGPCGLEVCGWYVGIYLGPINMHIKPYIGNCGTCGMGINPRIRGYLHLRCQNRGAVHATTSNTYFRTINTHDMPVALSYFPSG
jgi:hypothetical protein